MDARSETRTPHGVAALWKDHLRQSSFRSQFIISVSLFAITLTSFTRFLGWVEARDGAVFNDPILRMIEPRDFTWLSFGMIYVAVIIAVVSLGKQPRQLLLAIRAYTLMVLVRTVMMSLVPLNPPDGLIVLQDPLVQFVGDGSAPTKDLFFSGHTSTMFLLFLVSQKKLLKATFLVFTVLVATCVVLQHVHYVIDVVVAPFVAYACFRMALRFGEKVRPAF